MTKKPNQLQFALLKFYDCDDGCSAGMHGKSLSAMVKRGWMIEIRDSSRPIEVAGRRWRTTPAGREAARLS